jgi:DNA modification methylase
MKTVWRKTEFTKLTEFKNPEKDNSEDSVNSVSNVWTMTAPGGAEKEFGKHPTQKPVALIERCLLASTNEGDLVLDPFLGGDTTAVRPFVSNAMRARLLN